VVAQDGPDPATMDHTDHTTWLAQLRKSWVPLRNYTMPTTKASNTRSPIAKKVCLNSPSLHVSSGLFDFWFFAFYAMKRRSKKFIKDKTKNPDLETPQLWKHFSGSCSTNLCTILKILGLIQLKVITHTKPDMTHDTRHVQTLDMTELGYKIWGIFSTNALLTLR
jgi:hypothetical protein